MSSSNVFRWSLVIGPATALLGLVYAWAAADSFSQDWQDLLAWNGDGSWLLPTNDETELEAAELVAAAALLVFGLAAIANQIAMFFFWPPSRHLYAVLCVLGYALTPSFGLTVQTPVETLAYELSAFIAGATLAMAYLPPVNAKFKRIDRQLESAHADI